VPVLAQDLGKFSQDGFAVNVVRKRSRYRREISIMTPAAMASEVQEAVKARVLQCLPLQIQAETHITFRRGRVEASSGGSGDKVKNWTWHAKPMMGDSVGVQRLEEGGTLSALLQIGEKGYWLVNCHILYEPLPHTPTYRNTNQKELCSLVQPSMSDYDRFKSAAQEGGLQIPAHHVLGRLAAWSGPPFTTYREISSGHRVVTDWALFEASCLEVNSVRKTDGVQFRSVDGIKRIQHPRPGEEVHSAGRTSGYLPAQICEVPAIVHPGKEYEIDLPDGKTDVCVGNGTKLLTREWFLEHRGEDDLEQWITEGTGVPGDSGGPVICGNALCGQIWGRNKYTDENAEQNPPIAYFTSAADLVEDIAEKADLGRPMLPTEESIRQAYHNSLPGKGTESHPTRSRAKPQGRTEKRLPREIHNLLASLHQRSIALQVC
jgi:hypothetical protein